MSLEKKYSKEVKQILAKYPPEHKRSAVMPLLYLAQREEGYVNKEAMKDIAQMLDITESTSRSNLVKARSKLKDLLTVSMGNYGK